jgi:hypothetical protein
MGRRGATFLSVLVLLVQGSCKSPETLAIHEPGNVPPIDNPKLPGDVNPVIPKKRRVLIIGLDGTTGNQFNSAVWHRNRAPNLRSLLEIGKFTPCVSETDPQCARTHRGHRWGSDFTWKTGPGWASVLTGVESIRHQIKDNGHENFSVFQETTKAFPTIFKKARDQGLKVAAGGVGAFVTSRNGKSTYYGITDYECANGAAPEASSTCNLDYRFSALNKDDQRDNNTMQFMISRINDPQVSLVMGVFDKIDSEGHAHGFDSNNSYFNAIAATDNLIGPLISAVYDSVRRGHEEWMIIVTADHGGHRAFFWGDHGAIYDEDEVVPFGMSLIGSNQTLKNFHYPVTHMDTHPTALRWLGVQCDGVDGKIQGIE